MAEKTKKDAEKAKKKIRIKITKEIAKESETKICN